MAGSGILILGNMNKAGVAECIDSLRGWVGSCAEVLGVYPHVDFPQDIARRAKLCIVFGGDGTLLSAGREIAPLAVPLLGVNMGKLGFLADYDPEHLKRHLPDILAGAVSPIGRIMLSVRARSCGPGQGGCGCEDTVYLATNDVAISAGDPFRMIGLDVSRGSQRVARYLGDGLVVATPTGSTGYNLSAGGPIIDPTLDAMVITPVAPHTLSLRPMVVPAGGTISITATRVNEGTKLIIDGQVPQSLVAGQVVEVSRAEKPLMLFPHPGRDFFQTLADKLHWGQSPHHAE